MRTCATPDCGKALDRRNTSGHCRRCTPRLTLAKLRQDPAFLDRERARRESGLAAMKASRRQSEPDVIARRVATRRERKLGWCPLHLRDEYLRVMRAGRFPAAEARAIILAQFDADLRRRSTAA